MPEDIHASLWTKVIEIFEDGSVAVTAEISQEMTNIPGLIGKCVNANKDQLVLEVNAVDWDWQKYVTCSNELIATHRAFISEYTGGSPKTVDLIDMSIIALAKALGLPLVSMEKLITAPGAQKKRIPNICQHEGIEHLDFNDFLRREKLTF